MLWWLRLNKLLSQVVVSVPEWGPEHFHWLIILIDGVLKMILECGVCFS